MDPVVVVVWSALQEWDDYVELYMGEEGGGARRMPRPTDCTKTKNGNLHVGWGDDLLVIIRVQEKKVNLVTHSGGRNLVQIESELEKEIFIRLRQLLVDYRYQ